MALVLTGVINASNLALWVIGVTIAAAIAYFVVILTSRLVSGEERSRIVAFIPLFITNAAFWSLYQQQFTVVTIYSDKRLDRNIFGWEFPVSWVQSINPIFIIVLSGVFAAIWTKWGTKQPSTPLKFAAGTVLMGLAFFLFLFWAGGGANSTPLLAMVGILFVFTVAELLISPSGPLGDDEARAARSSRRRWSRCTSCRWRSERRWPASSPSSTRPRPKPCTSRSSAAVAIVIGILLALISPWVLRMMRGIR